MSRVGKKIIKLPPKVKVAVGDGEVVVEGPKGRLAYRKHPAVDVEVADGQIVCKAIGEGTSKFQGLARALIANMVTGVVDGYKRELEVNGVGYKAELRGDTLNMTLGLSHEVNYKIPTGIKAQVEKNRIVLTGIDKAQLGQVAAELRAFRPPEPYKGKGVKYVEETIRRKVGKAGA